MIMRYKESFLIISIRCLRQSGSFSFERDHGGKIKTGVCHQEHGNIICFWLLPFSAAFLVISSPFAVVVFVGGQSQPDLHVGSPLVGIRVFGDDVTQLVAYCCSYLIWRAVRLKQSGGDYDALAEDGQYEASFCFVMSNAFNVPQLEHVASPSTSTNLMSMLGPGTVEARRRLLISLTSKASGW